MFLSLSASIVIENEPSITTDIDTVIESCLLTTTSTLESTNKPVTTTLSTQKEHLTTYHTSEKIKHSTAISTIPLLSAIILGETTSINTDSVTSSFDHTTPITSNKVVTAFTTDKTTTLSTESATIADETTTSTKEDTTTLTTQLAVHDTSKLRDETILLTTAKSTTLTTEDTKSFKAKEPTALTTEETTTFKTKVSKLLPTDKTTSSTKEEETPTKSSINYSRKTSIIPTNQFTSVSKGYTMSGSSSSYWKFPAYHESTTSEKTEMTTAYVTISSTLYTNTTLNRFSESPVDVCSYDCPCIFGNGTLTIETLETRLEQLKAVLQIDKKETSSYVRKRTCATDSRPSAKNIGYIGILILVVVFGSIVLSDLISLVRFMQGNLFKKDNKLSTQER